MLPFSLDEMLDARLQLHTGDSISVCRPAAHTLHPHTPHPSHAPHLPTSTSTSTSIHTSRPLPSPPISPPPSPSPPSPPLTPPQVQICVSVRTGKIRVGKVRQVARPALRGCSVVRHPPRPDHAAHHAPLRCSFSDPNPNPDPDPDPDPDPNPNPNPNPDPNQVRLLKRALESRERGVVATLQSNSGMGFLRSEARAYVT